MQERVELSGQPTPIGSAVSSSKQLSGAMEADCPVTQLLPTFAGFHEEEKAGV